MLEGSTWQLIELGGKAIAPEATNQPPTIQFDSAAKTVTGSTGCNSLRGRYTLQEKKLIFGPIASTRRACAKGMEIEAEFSEALGRTDGYEMKGRRLSLTSSGRRLARFEAAGQ